MRIRSSLFALSLAALSLTPVSPAVALSPPPPPGDFVPRLSDVTGYGDATEYGSTNSVAGNSPIVGIARTKSSRGYWEAAVDGGVFAFGDARFHGSMGGTHLNQPVVGIAATPSGKGYWLVANDGGVFTFGDARFLGSMGGTPLSRPVVGIAPSASGRGYWMVGSDGGVFTFGNARFFGAASALASPIVGIAPRPARDGYWMVDAAGKVFGFGAARSRATKADTTKPIVGIAATTSGNGYWLAGRGTAPVYYLRGEELGVATRDVRQGAGPDAVLNVLRDLFAGPKPAERAAGLATATPGGSNALDISVSGRVATVEVSPGFVSGGGSLSMQARVAQVVFTLTGLPNIDRVAFSLNGRKLTTIGGEGLIVDPPVGRADFESFLPQVLVETPGPGDVITSPLVVTGRINSYEGGATFELNASDGRLLAEGIGQGAMGSWQRFASSIGFQSGSVATGTLTARPSSGVEGVPPADAVIPIRFRP